MKKRTILSGVFFILALPAVLHAESQTEKIKQLEEKVETLQQQQQSTWDELGSKFTVGGYGVVEYEKFQDTTNHFNGLKFEFLLGGRIHDRLRFYSEIEFERVAGVGAAETTTTTCSTPTGTTTCVIGVDGGAGGAIEVEQAYADFLIAQWINIRGGIVPVPFGKFNLNHFEPLHELTNRPIVARRIVPTTWSDVGFGLFGLVPLGDAVALNYEVFALNGLDDGFSATGGGLRGARPGFASDNNGDKAVAGRVALKFYDQYEVGLSGYRGDYNAASTEAITGLNGDLAFKPRGVKVLEDFDLIGEYAFLKVGGSTAPSSLWGFYLQLNYRFWPHFLDKTFLGKGFNSPTFTLAARYDHGKINTTAGTGNLSEDRYTVGLNYRPVANFVFKTEYQINNGGIERENNDGFIASLSWLF